MSNKVHNSKNTQVIEIAANVYAATNAADYIVIAKPMRGTWYYYMAALTPENVAAAMATVEATEDEGFKVRFRPSNGAFYKAANMAHAEVIPFATVDEVDARVKAFNAEHGTRVNRGVIVEQLIAEWFNAEWSYNPLQSGFWVVPDVVSSEGLRIQVKAYGGSVTEKDLKQAIEYCKR